MWDSVVELGWPFGPAIQLLILTGARRGEIGRLRWDEVTEDAISLSGERTKNGEPHTVPLSKPARIIIEALPKIAGSELVFTTNGKTAVSGWSKARSDLAELKEPWTLHDLRRTVATGLQSSASTYKPSRPC